MNEIYLKVGVHSGQEIPLGYTGKVIWSSGSIFYMKNGLFHSENGPAIYHNNPMLKMNHPEYKMKQYFLLHKEYSRDEWFELLTPKQKVLALMNFENFTE